MYVQATISKPIQSPEESPIDITPFKSALAKHRLELVRQRTHTLQINLGFLCNQTCQHCHLNAGPDRNESAPDRIN